MARLHLKYRNIRPSVIQSVKDAINGGIFATDRDNLSLSPVQDLTDKICAEYGVESVNIVIDSSLGRAWGYREAEYDSLGNQSLATIFLRKFSLFSLLSAIALHLNENRNFQFHRRGFAASVFYAAAPSTFRKAVRFGKIAGVDAVDTFSTETWEKLQAFGLTVAGKLRPVVTPETVQSVIDGTYEPLVDEYEDDEPEVSETVEATNEDFDLLFGDTEDTDEEPEIERATPPVEGETLALDALNRDELRKLAAELNIAGRGRMLAPELREAIREAQTV